MIHKVIYIFFYFSCIIFQVYSATIRYIYLQDVFWFIFRRITKYTSPTCFLLIIFALFETETKWTRKKKNDLSLMIWNMTLHILYVSVSLFCGIYHGLSLSCFIYDWLCFYDVNTLTEVFQGFRLFILNKSIYI